MAHAGLVFIGIKGCALALDRATGTQIWSTPIKGSEFVNVAYADGALYATARGEICCLDPATGHTRWTNKLTGYGLGLISIATAGGGQAVLVREEEKREEAANG